jgi:hypothetical protein
MYHLSRPSDLLQPRQRNHFLLFNHLSHETPPCFVRILLPNP